MSDHIGHGRPSEILHIADVHFSASALPYLEEPCAEIVRQAREIRPDAIVIAGDLTTHRGLIDNATAVAARTFVARLAQIARVYILAGNHDLTFKADEPNNLRAILSDDTDSVLPNVFVVDRPWVDRWRGINLAFVPYPSIATYHAATGSDDGDDLRLRLVDVVEGLKAQCFEEGGPSLAVFHGTVEGGRFGDESSAAHDAWLGATPGLVVPAAAERPRRDPRPSRWPASGDPGADLRAVLHDQAPRGRQRARTRGGKKHRQRS